MSDRKLATTEGLEGVLFGVLVGAGAVLLLQASSIARHRAEAAKAEAALERFRLAASRADRKEEIAHDRGAASAS